MQVARIIDPHDRTIPGKLKQIFRALQLEYRLSKEQILTLYINYAPFGGVIEGVQAAGFAYLGKSASELSHAEAALLAVLPQSPSRFRPDRHPDRAAKARDKVLDRLANLGVWDRRVTEEAKVEQIEARFNPRPMLAPLLARRLKTRAAPLDPVRTYIDVTTQEAVEDAVRLLIAQTPPHTSAAVLVMENDTLAVRAYVGSADFTDNDRFGHVDMVRAIRSPGSTLKPFLYGFALEEGLIHSESLLMDAPRSFSGYRPENFTGGFSGPVSAREALVRSLNIPAVELLEMLGPKLFDARLRQGGLDLDYLFLESPNLSMILGGVGTDLEALVGAYSALARQGLAGRPRYVQGDPVEERRMLDPGAAFIVRAILQDNRRPDLPGGRIDLARSRQVAWKTGTSYGFRDAWALGVTDEYTIGVWIGRPDGTPSPGRYGRAAAAPLLFAVVDSLPRRQGPAKPIPDNVGRTEICWPLGTVPSGEEDPLCHQRRTAWTLNGLVPPTPPDRADKHWLPNPVTVLVNADTGLRVEADCLVARTAAKTVARWPRGAEPWLTPGIREASSLPPLDPLCHKPAGRLPDNIKIVGLEPETILRPQGVETELPTVTLQAMGGQGRIFWLLDRELIAESGVGEIRYYHFQHPGRYQAHGHGPGRQLRRPGNTGPGRQPRRLTHPERPYRINVSGDIGCHGRSPAMLSIVPRLCLGTQCLRGSATSFFHPCEPSAHLCLPNKFYIGTEVVASHPGRAPGNLKEKHF